MDAKTRANCGIAADILTQEVENPEAQEAISFRALHDLLAASSTEPTASWEKTNGDSAILVIRPIPDRQGRYLGVPFGSTGRLLIIFLT